MSDSVIDVAGKEKFDELISSSDKLIFVDFWAAWCGPCRMLGPVLHDLADKYVDKMLVVKIDVDNPENRELAMKYGVRSIPQVTIFKDGESVDQFIGVLPPEHIEAFLTKYSA